MPVPGDSAADPAVPASGGFSPADGRVLHVGHAEPGAGRGSGAHLPRTVVLLGGVSLLADVSGEMVYPLLPLFVVGVLGAPAAALGVIEGAAEALVSLLRAGVGWQSDRLRRRVVYLRVGYFLPVVGRAMLALAYAWPLVLVARLVDRLGKGVRGSPRDALIVDTTPTGLRGRAFGLHRAMDTAGALVGVTLAAGLMWLLGESPGTAPGGETSPGGLPSGGAGLHADAFRTIFLIAGAVALASFVLTLFVREPGPVRDSRSQTAGGCVENNPAGTARGTLDRDGPRERLSKRYWSTLGLLALFSLAASSDTFLLLRAQDMGLTAWQVIGAYALYNLVYSLTAYPFGALSDRLGRWRVIGIGWFIYAGVYGAFGAGVGSGGSGAGVLGVCALMGVYGVFGAMTDGVAKALIADVTPASRRALGLGVYQMFAGFGALTASIIAGVMWDRVNHAAPFWFAAGVSGIAAILATVRAGVSRSAGRAEPPPEPREA